MKINATSIKQRDSKSNCLILGSFEDGKNRSQNTTVLGSVQKSNANEGLSKKDFLGKWRQAQVLFCGHSGSISYFLGLGKKSEFNYEKARRLGAAVYKKAKAEKWKFITVDFGSMVAKVDAYAVQSFCEGLQLAAYTFTKYKSKPSKGDFDLRVELLYKEAKQQKFFKEAIVISEIVARGVNLARSLGNEPPNTLYPESYAQQIREVSKKVKMKCQVLDEVQLAKLKMGGILGVGVGSIRKPRLVIMEYKPNKAKNKRPIVLVGKGVTFDTGGISIKPSNRMDEMKYDMCGSAAVVGAMQIIAELGLPAYVVGITPLAENMPGGAAQRPGDIIRCFNGKTVEVLNTDAEGRLILADALAYAKKYDPKALIDIATLTGACAHTLDNVASGVLSNNPSLVKKLMSVGEKTGERLWEFPLWSEYSDMIKGTFGDIRNMSRKTAGIQTSATFLQHFGGHCSNWAHLDIAGTAWGAPNHYNPEGGTGVGVRLFVEFVKQHA